MYNVIIIDEKQDTANDLEAFVNWQNFDAKIVAVINVKDNNPLQTLYKEVEKVEGIKTISIRTSLMDYVEDR